MEWKLEKEVRDCESAKVEDVGDLQWLDFERRRVPEHVCQEGASLSQRRTNERIPYISGITAGEHLARAMAYIIWLSTPITILLLHSHG